MGFSEEFNASALRAMLAKCSREQYQLAQEEMALARRRLMVESVLTGDYTESEKVERLASLAKQPLIFWRKEERRTGSE